MLNALTHLNMQRHSGTAYMIFFRKLLINKKQYCRNL